MKMNVIDIILLSSLSCSTMYFLATLLSHNDFKMPLSFVMLMGFIVGIMHILEKVGKSA